VDSKEAHVARVEEWSQEEVMKYEREEERPMCYCLRVPGSFSLQDRELRGRKIVREFKRFIVETESESKARTSPARRSPRNSVL
jgi:hypothetical protein